MQDVCAATEQLPVEFVCLAQQRLQFLYGETHATEILNQLCQLVIDYRACYTATPQARWNEQDVVLITYADSIRHSDEAPLQTLARFLMEYLSDTVSSVHILPFFPYSSDDGFSVIDYRKVDPALGNWEDIQQISQKFKLMADLVLNHISRESAWFADYLHSEQPRYQDFFITLPPHTDVSLVVRPRSTPLLIPVHTRRGEKYVWATFGTDQIDVNYANPMVLLEFLDILLFYVQQGARLIRLDAVGFLWKILGTNCMHLPQTHEVVKLMRDVLQVLDPSLVLITETNVPNEENLSYFGDGDEAHMVYQFSLPPLLLHALHFGTSEYLTQWAQSLRVLPAGCTYFNFTASHDGIGLRPATGLLPGQELGNLIAAMYAYGGQVSMRSNEDGSNSPYEINIALFDAFRGTCQGSDQWQVQRFLCSQTLMLALQGVPAIYIHSLFATPNYQEGVQRTQQPRTINRRKWAEDELQAALRDPNAVHATVFNAMRHLLKLRRAQAAFHPEARQRVLNISSTVFGVWRESQFMEQKVLALNNLSVDKQTVDVSHWLDKPQQWRDLISGLTLNSDQLILQPYQSVWLTQANLPDMLTN